MLGFTVPLLKSPQLVKAVFHEFINPRCALFLFPIFLIFHKKTVRSCCGDLLNSLFSASVKFSRDLRADYLNSSII